MAGAVTRRGGMKTIPATLAAAALGAGCLANEPNPPATDETPQPLAAAAHTFTPLSHQPPVAITVPILLRDRTVIAQQVSTSNWYKLTPDVNGSYVNGTWAPIASMPSTYGPLY